jgi:hypothetical protein
MMTIYQRLVWLIQEDLMVSFQQYRPSGLSVWLDLLTSRYAPAVRALGRRKELLSSHAASSRPGSRKGDPLP